MSKKDKGSNKNHKSIHSNQSSAKKIRKDPSSSKGEKILLPKGRLVISFLKRWWYAIEEWPPKDFDYTEKLKQNNLRSVSILDWRIEPDEDSSGKLKCIELNGFPGVFRDYKGKCYDLRPKEMCPSYNNFMEKVSFFT